MMVKQDGSVWATGSNIHGQLGDGSTTDRNSFVKVKSSGATAVAAGFAHTMVLTQDGGVWTTGWNLYGQCGDGSMTSTSNLIKVTTLGDNAVHDGANPEDNFQIRFSTTTTTGKTRI